jgi:hypothetical protein
VTDDEFRAVALGLPETTEGRHDGLATFLVRGKRFATLGWPEQGVVSLVLEIAELEMLLEAAVPGVSRTPGAFGQRGHARLDLNSADRPTIDSMIAMAWRRVAPAGLRKAALNRP